MLRKFRCVQIFLKQCFTSAVVKNSIKYQDMSKSSRRAGHFQSVFIYTIRHEEHLPYGSEHLPRDTDSSQSFTPDGGTCTNKIIFHFQRPQEDTVSVLYSKLPRIIV